MEKKSSLIIIAIIFISIFISSCTAIGSSQKETIYYTTVASTSTLYNNAISAWYDGKSDLSIYIFNGILKKEPKNITVAANLLRLYEETGNNTAALELLETFNSGSSFNTYLILKTEQNALWNNSFLPLFLQGNTKIYLKNIELAIKKVSGSSSVNLDKLSDMYFFAGSAYSELGNTTKAIEAFTSAITVNGYNPLACLGAGVAYYNQKDYKNGEKYLSLALSQDSNLTQGRLYLAKSLIAQNRLTEGYAAIKRAIATRPWDTDAKLYLKDFEAQNPEIKANIKTSTTKKRTMLNPPEITVFTANPETMPTVKIGLSENLKSVFIKPGGDFVIKESSPSLSEVADGKVLSVGEKHTVLEILFDKENITIIDENGKYLLTSAKTVEISCSNRDEAILLFDVSHSSGYQSAGQEDRAYRGQLKFIPVRGKGITVVNTVLLEEYLYSVVPSEMPASWPEEALKAQAVAARSYTLANMGRFAKKGYDLSGSILSAFYRGVTGENKNTTAAVEATRALVLKSKDNKYLNAFYSANSAGITEAAHKVWGGNPTPIIGVKDPQIPFTDYMPSIDQLTSWLLSEPITYSGIEPYRFRSSYRWRLIVPAWEIKARIGKDIGEIKSISGLKRSPSGRVYEAVITGTKGKISFKNDVIRNRLGGLRSSLFVVMPKYSSDDSGLPEYFIFAGAGWGHGVGMCQTGAAGMAHYDFKYSDILNHYYPMAEIKAEY